MGFSYPWTRYWVERGQSSAADRGFLAVPEGEFAWACEERPRTLAEFASIPVLVLLGEPGMGKSRSLADEAARLKEPAGPSKEILCRNLNEYGAGELDRLRRDIFESESFSRYREGAELHLLLDSLDECKPNLPNLATWLAAQLWENVDAADRFRLRIGCRNGDWPNGLESKLRDQFPDDDEKPRVQVLELCPLRREDVAVAVRMHGTDADGFLRAVAAREIAPLAARPITLEMLIALWQKGDLPQSKVELYRRGLETLCDEHNPDRRDAGAVGTLTAQQRLRVAGRIAAAIMFCNRSAMWTGPGAPASDADFPASDLMGTDIAGGDGFTVSHPAVNETLAIAGLFSPRGEERVAFAHESYAEFLAAYYIAASDLTPERTLRLLQHSQSKEIVPQLLETAGWLASMDSRVREHLISAAPLALLSCDGTALTNSDRRLLANRLLEISGKAGLSPHDFTRQQWRKLLHPDLASQLKSVFVDRQSSAAVRDLALDIARHCRLGALCGAAIAVALDPDEEPWVRFGAAQFVVETGDADALRALRPLALSEGSSDAEIRMRELTVARLRLDYLSAEEFFSALNRTLRPNHIGTLRHLINSDGFIDSLAPHHLPAALSWVAGHSMGFGTDYALHRLAYRVLRLAVDHLDRSEVLNALGDTVLTLIRDDQPLFRGWNEGATDDPLADQGRRRTLLLYLMPRLDRQEIPSLVFAEEPIARQEDVEWLLDRIELGLEPSDRRITAELASALLRFNSPPQVLDRALGICEKPDLILRKALRWLVRPMRLKLKSTQEVRAGWVRWKERERNRQDRQPMDPPPQARVEQALSQCEEGNLEIWPRLAEELTLSSDGTHYSFPTKIHTLPGWSAADEATRQRILSAAFRYLQSAAAPDDELINRRTHYLDEFGGGLALELLLAVVPAMLDQVRREDRAKWAAVILAYNFDHDDAERVYRWTYAASPERFLDLTIRVLDRRNEDEQGVFNLRDFDCIWGDPLRERLETRLNDEQWSQKSKQNLLTYLAEHGVQRAIEHCRRCIESASGVEERIFAAFLLLMHDPALSWPRLNAAFDADPEFGREVIGKVAYESRWEDRLTSRLGDSQLADLCLRIEHWFPSQSDPRLEGTYSVRIAVADLRDRALSVLRNRGSREAVREIIRIRSALPASAWLDRLVSNAQANYLRATWEAPEVRDLLIMLSDPSKRLVRTGDELLDVVMEKLSAFQREAQHGSPPLAVFLWDEKIGEPKTEQRLSDFLKHWLTCEFCRTNVIVNREVEIRNWNPTGVGSRTDLLIEAKASGRSASDLPLISLVVEVKGAWNIDLNDMEAQLRDEYLDGQSRRYGIFLVGWFGSDHARPKALAMDDLGAMLAQQADTLSNSEKILRSIVVDLTHRTVDGLVAKRSRARKSKLYAEGNPTSNIACRRGRPLPRS